MSGSDYDKYRELFKQVRKEMARELYFAKIGSIFGAPTAKFARVIDLTTDDATEESTKERTKMSEGIEIKTSNLTPESWLAKKGYDINKALLVVTRKGFTGDGLGCTALSLEKIMENYAKAVVEEIEK